MFRDRQEAGRALALALALALRILKLHKPVVLALPRGRVLVALEIAKVLHAPLDLVVRKVGTPGNPELAAVAIVDGDPPHVVLKRATSWKRRGWARKSWRRCHRGQHEGGGARDEEPVTQ